MTDPTPKPQLHISGMELASNCGEAWRLRYPENIRIAPNAALIIGSGTHKAIDVNIYAKVNDGEYLDTEQVTEVARDQVSMQFVEGHVTMDHNEEFKGIDLVRANAIDKAVALVKLHSEVVTHLIDPAESETPWVVKCKNYPYDLAGTWDIIEKDASIGDTKTGAPGTLNQGTADQSVQLDGYAFAFSVNRGVKSPKLYLDGLIKTKVPKHERFETVRDDEDFQRFLRRFEVMCAMIEKEVFIPASPKWWGCSPEWCGYHAANGGPCKYTRGARRPKS